ncbi:MULTISPECIES: helix-turn-helix domain-containing protein [Halorussus]|uniref:helix-turn-helix domain-containing protein n=1 Tax=Halorussus TaxID=1070314 RepID=UPI00209DE15D|nr:helix-turn-helix domain-containing protein [Halorussus vallis]USZ75483.1 helix-turn-helix domain-containing protein [Halorussus vallis]
MPIAELQLDSCILRTAMTSAPDAVLRYEQCHRSADGVRLYAWVETDDFGAFAEALAADDTVANPAVLAVDAGRRLYRVEFTEAGRAASLSPVRAELDIVVLDARATAEGWTVRLFTPDNEALSAFTDECDERNLSFTVETLQQAPPRSGQTAAELTSPQREALEVALEEGYFEVPRRAALRDVAEKLGISAQAASERLRRGVASFLRTRLREE